jgi:aromatic-amino-acid transaminase
MTGASSSLALAGLIAQSPDPLLKVIAAFQVDQRADKIDLGVGVFKDKSGHTPIMAAVKQAEARLVETQETKTYLGAAGDTRFVELLEPLVFGESLAAQGITTGIQTPGGTGALRLAAGLVKLARPNAVVHAGDPTWPNHPPIFEAEGLSFQTHPFFDPTTQSIQFEAMMAALEKAAPGDVILLQAGCHNPTGATFSDPEWIALANLIARRELLPIIDLAYQGLGVNLEADAWSTRLIVNSVPETIVAYSCDKNFGLYRDRVGAVWTTSFNPARLPILRSNLLQLARAAWSMPPDHGAAVVRLILSDLDLKTTWLQELQTMQASIQALRQALATSHPRLHSLTGQTGMFSLLPLTPMDIEVLRQEHGIYIVDNGRINIAGLTDNTIARVARALSRFL